MERFIVVVQRSVSDGTPFSWVAVRDVMYHIIPVSNGMHMLEVAATFRPDLFLIEHNPPDLDGVALCQHLHTLAGQEEVPAVVVLRETAFPEDGSRIDAPYVSYTNEPFELNRLLGQAESMGIMPVQ